MNRWIVASALLLTACKPTPEPDGPKLMDTGWFVDTGVPPEECTALLLSTTPEEGANSIYWRDRPGFTVSETGMYDAWLVDERGTRFETTLEADDSGLRYTLNWDGFFEASTGYTLFVEDCEDIHEINFSTARFGEELIGGPSSLNGKTFLVSLVDAEWVRPSQLSAVISLYFNTPILLGVQFADETRLDIVGAPGEIDPLNGVSQDIFASSWDFPIADFSQSPFFDASVPQINLSYNAGYGELDIPVDNFVLQATISADGTEFGGGVISGLGDTRSIADELLGGESGLCDIAAGIGADCVPCSDGQVFCLDLLAVDVGGQVVPGLKIKAN